LAIAADTPEAERGHGEQRAGTTGGSGRGDARRPCPLGNNGTFKVDGLAYDDGMDNEPHVTCEFRLLFFGFDDQQRGTIDIGGHAPSGSGRVGGHTDVLLSNDDAGGGPNDPDEILYFKAADLDLAGLTAHPKQGYHLKITVLTGEPGGVKHKVVWLAPCAGATTTATPSPEVSASVSPTPTATPMPTPTPTPDVSASVSTSASASASASVSASVGGVVTTAPGGGTGGNGSGGGEVVSGGNAVQPEVHGVQQTRGGAGALAFTGSQLIGMAVAGIVLMALGVIALVTARRRTGLEH
jgi:hypothetical protein